MVKVPLGITLQITILITSTINFSSNGEIYFTNVCSTFEGGVRKKTVVIWDFYWATCKKKKKNLFICTKKEVGIYKIYLVFWHVKFTFFYKYKCFSFHVGYIPFCVVVGVQVSSTGLPGSGSMFVEGLTDRQLSSIVDEDFIELNDLMDWQFIRDIEAVGFKDICEY